MDNRELQNYIERNCSHLWNLLRKEEYSHVFNLILRSASPRNCAGRIDDLLATSPEITQSILIDPNESVILIKTLAGSRFLFSILMRHPHQLTLLFREKAYLNRKLRSDKESELRSRFVGLTRNSDFDRILRIYKDEDFLRIGIRDLSDIADAKEIMTELSDLAAAALQCAIDFHFQALCSKHGRPPIAHNGTGFVAIAMGKLAGRELNFSSDIDLILLREPEQGYTEGPEKINVVRFYETLSSRVTKSLSEITEDGFVFRTDLRLRPEGDKGELVPSVANALDYYLGWGRTWERAALMKAIPIAGDMHLGEEFVKELEPFIYRKYLDYSTIDEMRVMKLQIETQLKRKPGINIKLGQGGIREIEFFVQALQLINAGRKPRVRSSSTLEGLNLLRETGIIPKETGDKLREAYLFFRKTEHRIQINHQLQTHELPRTESEQEELAIKMGFSQDPLVSFLKSLESHKKIVEDLFSGMFYQSSENLPDRISPLIAKVMDSIEDPEIPEKLLAEAGFEDPAASIRIIRGLLNPSDKKSLTTKAKYLLQKLTPLFLEELVKMPEPSRAVLSLDGYIDSLRAHSTYFSTLLENPPTIRFIARILGESRFFTDLLIRHPQAIDSLIAKESDESLKTKEQLETSLEERLAYAEDFEDELDVLRRFKNEEMLVIGVNHLEGEIDSPAARKLVSNLADVCLQGAVEIALREMRRKFGLQDFFDPLPFVILGMGKLGAREMTYLSDLDIIFIYDSPVNQIGRFDAHEWFSRFAGRIISILNIPTAEGIAWAIDTRLRPSGNKGPLVSSIESFREYHHSSSQLWEKQALIKARPITGPVELTQLVENVIRERIMSTPIAETETQEIARIRKRMETELAMENSGFVDLKTGHGGLVDVEFVVQSMILKHAKDHPDIIKRNTLNALEKLRETGLLDEDRCHVLTTGYKFLSNLEDRLRIMEHKSIDRMPLNGDKLKSLARRLNYEENDEYKLVEDYLRMTQQIRSIYNSFFDA